MRNLSLSLLFLCITLLSIHRVAAQTQNCLNSFTMVGTAVSQGTGCYRLTDQNTLSGSGAIWSTNTIDLNNGFDLTFNVDQCGSADGVMFVLQNTGPNAIMGNNGSTLSYYDLSSPRTGVFAQSLGVELDIFANTSAPYFDPILPHMMLALNASPAAVVGPVVMPNLGNCLNSSHILRVTWTPGLNFLVVQLDGVTRLSYTQNLVANVFGGNPNVRFGFTGASGGASANQTICPLTLLAAPPAPTVTGPATICSGSTASLSVTNQAANTTYQWLPATGLNITTGATVVASPAVTTTYQVIATAPNGCQSTTSKLVTVLPIPVVTVSPAQTVCTGASATLTATSTSVGATYAWAPATGLSATTGPTVTATPTTTSRYTVTTTDTNGCTQQTVTTVTVVPPLNISVVAPPLVPRGSSFTLTATGAGAGASYQWLPATGLNNTTGATVQASLNSSTVYTVTARDANGCTGQATVSVPVAVMPNVITPNGDKMNDTFEVLVSFEPVTIQLFNRWGRAIYEQADYHKEWGAENQPAGIYYYRLATASGQSWKGWVEVIR